MPQATPSDDPQPLPPEQPDLNDCCHSGCSPCIFDLYDEALARYRTALAEWQARHATPTRQTRPRPPR
ncbi:oxidoreductase-like domain-containing protein [Paraburkholderia strydomiana]|uniref:oxidoreductase-like domain-containing protein n=1 Tax=Paraburkholderia strydomiana TaxID=1245417 RepID=UPI0038BCE8C1